MLKLGTELTYMNTAILEMTKFESIILESKLSGKYNLKTIIESIFFFNE